MLILIGFVIVFVSAMGGFMLAGGNPLVLLHISEFVVIGGISIGILMISTPRSVLSRLARDIIGSLKGEGFSAEDYSDMMKLLYELFMAGRRNGLLALDEHVSSPEESSIFIKYPQFLKDPHRIEFLCNALRPIIDGKLKPDQLVTILDKEIEAKKHESHEINGILTLIGDSLPGVGIVAAVLGIINTMSAIADGPDAVGYKVAAALTGTFLGIFLAYGFINPLNKNLEFRYVMECKYYEALVNAVVGFTRGFSPLMSLEIARRALPDEFKMESDALEEMLKSLNSQ